MAEDSVNRTADFGVIDSDWCFSCTGICERNPIPLNINEDAEILRPIAHAVLQMRFRSYPMSLHREFVLRRALRKLRQDPEACLNPKSTVVAERAGVALYALAHIETWGERIRNIAARLHIRNVHSIAAPLRNYGDYRWYSPPPVLLRRKFSLVLCDGPPGTCVADGTD